ncbi:MAG: hypothetical protein AAGG69_13480 [Pseudomonadota bacterium]
MWKRLILISAVSAFASAPALAQKSMQLLPIGQVMPDGTIVPELDPIITGSGAPVAPAPLNFEECDADCQAKKLGIEFND